MIVSRGRRGLKPRLRELILARFPTAPTALSIPDRMNVRLRSGDRKLQELALSIHDRMNIL